jgi:carboxypeptidase Taq
MNAPRELPPSGAAPAASATPAYDALCATWARLHRLKHVHAIAFWDGAVNMPPKGHRARAEAIAELDGLMHRTRTEPALRGLIDTALTEPLDPFQSANLREIRRDWRSANALPERLVQAKAIATSTCEHAWRTQRRRNDWAGFLPNFKEVVRLAREEANYLADDMGLSPYDALMDGYEPGLTSDRLDPVFDDLRTWLPELIRDVVSRQAAERKRAPLIEPAGPFDVKQQKALSLEVMRLLGFDFDAGRLDESAHPFAGGVPEDVRLTTRFAPDRLINGLMGTVHETGHARYEQGLPRSWLGQPVAHARSMALHESQSLFFEMQLGAHPGFVRALVPLLNRQFGGQDAFHPKALQRLLTKVEPGRIRVDADEVTYPAHILLRHGIERALIMGEIEAEDVPALWDQQMMILLGIDTKGDYADGCLQDVHWPEGLFGYFPCYTLGAMYAAQWYAAMRRAIPDLEECLGDGDFEPAFGWLREHIWTQGSRWETDELARRASGSALDPGHFRRHLERRYLGIGA